MTYPCRRNVRFVNMKGGAPPRRGQAQKVVGPGWAPAHGHVRPGKEALEPDARRVQGVRRQDAAAAYDDCIGGL